MTNGTVKRNESVRVIRDGKVIHTGRLNSLKRFKDDVKEVATGYECGIGIEKFNDIAEGDKFEFFKNEEIKNNCQRSLKWPGESKELTKRSSRNLPV